MRSRRLMGEKKSACPRRSVGSKRESKTMRFSVSRARRTEQAIKALQRLLKRKTWGRNLGS